MASHFIKFVMIMLFSFYKLNAGAGLFKQDSGHPFISAEQAFVFDFNQQSRHLTLSWQMKPGYYLYRQQIVLEPHNAQLAPFTLPAGKAYKDEYYGNTDIYSDTLSLPLTLRWATTDSSIRITYQGCAAEGFCYPPETRVIPLSEVTSTETLSAVNSNTVPQTLSTNTLPNNTLPFAPLWALLAGIGIAFTPCMLPMYPLISGIILGNRQQLSSGRVWTLALIYVQGMALTYTLIGVIVAAAGLRFQAALQNPYVLISLSAMFVLLALSMFGLFHLQLPSVLQTRLVQLSNHQRVGSLPSVLFMGALAGLMCSPCTTAPLSAILLYIAQTGNKLSGGGILYLYALGMGLPLIFITVFGNKLLPKSGAWMQTVKEGFGFVILALPIFFLTRLIDQQWEIRLWSFWGTALLGWAFIISLHTVKGWGRALQLLLLLATLISVRPLQDWVFAAPQNVSQATHLNFNRINTLDELNQSLKNNNGKISMLDLYADWCPTCKALEKETFSDVKVQHSLAHIQPLQVDVTRSNASNSALLQHLGVLGLPTILFFDTKGNEILDSRISGFINPTTFLIHLQEVGATAHLELKR